MDLCRKFFGRQNPTGQGLYEDLRVFYNERREEERKEKENNS